MKPTFKEIKQAYFEELYEHSDSPDSDLYSDLAKTYADENEHIPNLYNRLCTAFLEGEGSND